MNIIREDSFELALFFRDNPIGNEPEAVLPILEVIEGGGAFRPDVIGVRRKYTPQAVVAEIRRELPTFKVIVTLTRRESPTLQAELSFVYSDFPIGFWIRLTVPMTAFDEAEGKMLAERLRAVACGLASNASLLYGYGHSRADLVLAGEPHLSTPEAPAVLQDFYWLNVFGPGMVESIGRERLLSTPDADASAIAEGGIVTTLHFAPQAFAGADARAMQARARAHCAPEQSEQDVLARLAARNDRLAPRTAGYDPDIEPLVAMLLDDVLFAHRQEELDRWNAFTLAPVDEWQPLDEPEPSPAEPDGTVVEDIERRAEQFATLVAQYVPAVLDYDPAHLPAIDHHFWRFDYRSSLAAGHIDDVLVPAAGAYLALVMVRNLGGRWGAGTSGSGIRVVIGNRVWLPTERARRWLSGREGAIVHSFTKYYHEASRNAAAM